MCVCVCVCVCAGEGDVGKRRTRGTVPPQTGDGNVRLKGSTAAPQEHEARTRVQRSSHVDGEDKGVRAWRTQSHTRGCVHAGWRAGSPHGRAQPEHRRRTAAGWALACGATGLALERRRRDDKGLCRVARSERAERRAAAAVAAGRRRSSVRITTEQQC